MIGNKYYKQLDSFRAIAVFLVIVHHWLPGGHLINRFLPNGTIGVTLFFVLSGFLISEILLREKIKRYDVKSARFMIFKNFYIRRSLRIIPVYYVTLIILFFLPASPDAFKSNIIYHFLYGTNLLFYFADGWGFGAHLWTLSVEEQFYLVWPIVIILSPKRYLSVIVVGFITFGIVSKFIFPVNQPLTAILTPTCFDSFGIGALIAITKADKSNAFFLKFRSFIGVTSIFLFIIYLLVDKVSYQTNIAAIRILFSFISAYLIIHATTNQGFKGIIGLFLENRTLLYLGKISYSLYLFHNFIPWFNEFVLFNKFPELLIFSSNSWLFFIFNLIVLISLSSFSWYFLERPINGLKRYFVYA